MIKVFEKMIEELPEEEKIEIVKVNETLENYKITCLCRNNKGKYDLPKTCPPKGEKSVCWHLVCGIVSDSYMTELMSTNNEEEKAAKAVKVKEWLGRLAEKN